MTLKIEIDLHPDHGDLRTQLVSHVAAIGFTPMSAPSPAPEPRTGSGSVGNTAVTETTGASETAVTEPQTTAVRERGKPMPGRARRTKEEIAEDEAADAADAAAAGEQTQETSETTGRSISNDPENRVDPATYEQDAADETAEVEANRKEETPLTREDVKAAMTGYVKAYGLPATQEDGPKLIGSALGNPPKGEDYWKLSLIPEDQDALRKVVASFTAAVKDNPFSRAGA